MTLLLCCGCTQKDASFTLHGTVVDEAGNGVADASVALVNASMSSHTASDGSFKFTLPTQPTTSITLTAIASGYARSSRVPPSTTLAQYNKVAVMLRAPQSVTTVALPPASSTTTTAQVVDADGSTILTISPNSLITPSGGVANGNVQIALTYWHPKKSLASLPGSLFTANPAGAGALDALETFGMTDIEITQNGDILQVAAGKTLGLQFNVPKAQWLNLQARVGSTNAQPNLYSLDMNSGLWVLEGTLADPNRLTFEPNTGIFQAQLPHLSAWNMDGVLTNQGGRVQGHAVDTSGNPAANKQVRVYFVDRDEVKDFLATTNANGDYCADTGYTPPNNYAVEQVPYYVAGADSATDSDQCNPLPPYCSDCSFESLYCMNCANRSPDICSDNGAELTAWGDNSCASLPSCTSASSQSDIVACGYKFVDTCSPTTPQVTITPCHFCSNAPGTCSAILATGSAATFETMPGVNGDCGQLRTVVLGGTAPPGGGGGGTTTGGNKCPNQILKGGYCDQTANPICCAPGLICSDYVCVPSSD